MDKAFHIFQNIQSVACLIHPFFPIRAAKWMLLSLLIVFPLSMTTSIGMADGGHELLSEIDTSWPAQ